MLPVFEEQNCSPQVIFESSLYHAPANEWQEILVELPNEAQRVMFLGHNPGAEEFVAGYSGVFHMMPTAAIALFEFEVEQWSQCERGNASLCDVWRPKEVLFQD